MKFFDFAREWVIKNIPEQESNREIVLKFCKYLGDEAITVPRAVGIVKYLHRLVNDYVSRPDFYEPYRKYE